MRLIRIWYCKRKVKGAQHDIKYFLEEADRCVKNVEVARLHRNHWQYKLMEAKYPVRPRMNVVVWCWQWCSWFVDFLRGEPAER